MVWSQFMFHISRKITVVYRKEFLNFPLSVRCRISSKVFTAATMKNVVFWDIKTQFEPHRRHITSPLQSPAGSCYVDLRFSRR
jgi:hypothetical protein